MPDHNPGHSRLPTELKTARAQVQAYVLGFDRVSFSLDHPAPSLPLQILEKHCRKVEIINSCTNRYQPLWQTRVALHQPDQDALRLLQIAIKNGCYRSRPDYAEIALDHVTVTRQDAVIVRNFFLKHMLVPHARKKVHCEKNETFYYNRRTPVHGGKAPRVTVIYCDKPSKLAGEYKGQPCSHLEQRFSGSDALSGIGINCLADFASFSHESFWHTNLKLACLPAKADISRFLLPEKADCSGTALRKRADKFLAPFFLKDVFILQNLRLAHPGIKGILREMECSFMLPNRLRRE